MISEQKGSMEIAESRLAKTRLIVTDWSGVISDDRPPVYESNMRMLEARGLSRVSFEEWLPTTRLSPVEYFIEVCGLAVDRNKIMQEYAKVFSSVRNEGIVPVVYPDAQEILKRLHESGRKIVVVSSHPEEHLRREAHEYTVTEFISGFRGGTKDKSKAILATCKSYLVDISETLYMGDTIYDIQAAKKAGVISIGMSTGYHTKERLLNEGPNYIFDSLRQLNSKM